MWVKTNDHALHRCTGAAVVVIFRRGGKALHFVLGDGEMIRGWDVGLVGMRQGGTRRLVVPPAMGYGERGAGPVPGGATLIFEIMLLNVI